jgi:hypothetical protein
LLTRSVLQSYYFIQKHEAQITSDGVKYNERLYRKTGESWGDYVALVSTRKTRIAVFSYTSREKDSGSIIPGMKNTEPGSGEVFLDVYDVSSGDKVGSARSPFGQNQTALLRRCSLVLRYGSKTDTSSCHWIRL